MIELHFWQQLAAIAECGTISAAAEKLHVTQPALSRSMKRMEELLDVRLFHRGKNKIELSDAGRLAAEYAVRLLENEADIVEKLRLFERARHTIQVGSCAPVPLRELVPRLTDRYPDKAVTAEVREEAVLMRQFAEGTMQIIVLTHPLEQEGIFCKKLLEARLLRTAYSRLLCLPCPKAGFQRIDVLQNRTMNISLPGSTLLPHGFEFAF